MTPIDELDEETQFKVFWLQDYLYRNGIEGIHFREVMLKYLEGDAEDDIERSIERSLNGKRF